MTKQNFYFDIDGDLRTTSQPIQQSGYFMDLNPGYVMTIDGDKYRAVGEGQKAVRVTAPLSEISDIPPWL